MVLLSWYQLASESFGPIQDKKNSTRESLNGGVGLSLKIISERVFGFRIGVRFAFNLVIFSYSVNFVTVKWLLGEGLNP